MADTELALLIDRLLRRIHTSLQTNSAAFDSENVGPAGGLILLTLSEMGAPELNELTRRFARDKSQMTRVVRMLEAKGLVDRSPSKRDSRASVIRLTKKGETVVSALETALTSAIGEILSPLSDDETQILKDLMRRAVDQ
ncbi:MAG: MarR family transcriptional regulator [Pseudomonadota bacterium]